MNQRNRTLLLLALGSLPVLAQSNSSSTNFDLLTAPPGGGGGQVSGGNITAQVSAGGDLGGPVSNLTTGGVQEKPNFIGQLYDVSSLALDATPLTIDEAGSRQLGATATLDDLTLLVLDATDVQWSVVLGPLSGIDSAGLATADLVYEDTAATAQGSSQGVSGQLGLTVLDTIPDNFGSYAGDGLGDNWQVAYFGNPPNADAGPGMDPDHDLHDNRFEFLTGYDPTDSGAFFTLEAITRVGTTATLELSKIIPGTRYRLERSNDLNQADPWTEFTNFTTLSEVFDHQVDDQNASGVRWFYRLGVEPE